VATVDWIALAVVVLSAFGGWRRGLIGSALSLGGLVAGAYAGSRLAPHLLSGGSSSRWTPFLSLVGALAGAMLLHWLASFAGSFLRSGLKLTPLRLLDSAGGVFFGAATGLVLVWVLGATALLLPGQTSLRREAQRSQILQNLNAHVPPRRLLHLLASIDPLQAIAGPPAPLEPPSPAIARDPEVRRAEDSVVRVLGTACGLGVEGSGWFITSRDVATAAHVVAGEHDTHVQLPHASALFRADVVAFDATNDLAILRVRNAGPQSPLRVRTEAQSGRAVAIVGYPEGGPLTATPGRVGDTATVLTRDAYGHGPVSRSITAVAGDVRHGDSGGPAVDSDGYVQTMLFAARIGQPVGYGVPIELVVRAAQSAQGPVSTGDCAVG
jgi:S1-C subfamily serine protease